MRNNNDPMFVIIQAMLSHCQDLALLRLVLVRLPNVGLMLAFI